jgi:hypothetical protein
MWLVGLIGASRGGMGRCSRAGVGRVGACVSLSSEKITSNHSPSIDNSTTLPTNQSNPNMQPHPTPIETHRPVQPAPQPRPADVDAGEPGGQQLGLLRGGFDWFHQNGRLGTRGIQLISRGAGAYCRSVGGWGHAVGGNGAGRAEGRGGWARGRCQCGARTGGRAERATMSGASRVPGNVDCRT